MASVSKLAVRGIRAFSPDDEEQVISFYSPLTVIVGNNGCGKTTVIESLRYAICGTLPPGNRSGQAFVHDPKSVGQSSVKANVKLRFTNRAGNSMVVVRSMELTQKKTNLTFKALDGILRTTDPNTGDRVSLSHKCTELDRQIPTLMGVSKPILEHVVFTHQEDSSWPLMEGAILKKRFDDIFDSTRYAKALEAIRKSRTEYNNVAKNHKVTLAGLASHKHAAEGFRTEMDEAKDELSEIDQRIVECDEKIEEETEKRAKLEKVIGEMNELKDRADQLRADEERDEMVAVSKRSMLEEDWTETQTGEQLEAMLSGFDDVIRSDVRRRDEAERERDGMADDIERLRERTMALNGRKAKLEGAAEEQEAVLRQRVRLVEEMADRYDLSPLASLSQRSRTPAGADGMGTQQSAVSGLTGATPGRPSLGSTVAGGTQETGTVPTLTSEDMEAVNRAVEEKESSLRKELGDHRKASQREEDELQDQLGELSAKAKGVEGERQRSAARRGEAQSELSKIAREHGAGTSRVRKSDIEEAKRNAAKFAKDRDKLNKDPRKDVIPREIKAHEEKIESLRRAVEDDAVVLRELRQCADNQATIDMLRHQLLQDVEGVEEVLRENSFLLQKHDLRVNTDGFGRDDEGVDRVVEETKGLAERAREMHDDKKHDLSRVEEEVHAAQRGASEKGALVGHNRRLLADKRQQAEMLGADNRGVQKIRKIITAMIRYEETMGVAPSDIDVRQDMDPQDLMKHLRERSQDFSIDEVTPETVRAVMKRLRLIAKQVDESGNTVGVICPCCRREMDTEEAKTFKRSLNEFQDPETSEILLSQQASSERNKAAKANYDRWHASVQQSVTDYLQYKQVVAEIESMETATVEGEDALKRFQADLDSANSRAKGLREDVADLRQVLDVATRLRDDAERMFDKKTQITTKQEDLAISAPAANGRDLATVEREVQARMDEKDSLTQAITRLNKELSAINDQISRVTNQAAKAEQMARDKEKRFAREQEASVKRTELSELIAKCQQEEKKLGEQIVPIRQKIRAKESDRQRMRSSSKAEEDRLNENLNQFKADAGKLNDLTSRIDRYVQSDKQEQLNQVTQEIIDIADQQNNKEKTLEEMKPRLEKLNKKVNDQERHKKTIQGNIELLNLIKGIKEKREELNLLEEEIEAVRGSDTSMRDYETAGKRIQKYEQGKAQCEGRRSGVKDQIKNLKRKLQTTEYKDIDERHRQKMIEYETTQIAVEDLDKYDSALDKALLRYHGMKIADINKIIRELWTLTYKGEDITNIQLESGQEKGGRAARSYNYRVVMTKGNTQLDMRGRCSAGQRVLASIVIRLALAETFCLNCGVMCLDEPTTNLDYANKRGLAVALAQIIANRASQTNFQLVVITHDEDFVTMMKNELAVHTGFNMPERYFQVSREEGSDGKHYSKIHAIDWDEL